MKIGRWLIAGAVVAVVIWKADDIIGTDKQQSAAPPAVTESASASSSAGSGDSSTNDGTESPEPSATPTSEHASPSSSGDAASSGSPAATPEASEKPSNAADESEDSGDSDSLSALLQLNAPDKTIEVGKNGVATVTNPESMLVLVNKKRELSSTYAPDDLVKPDVEFSFSGDSPKQKMRKTAASALEKLFAGAQKDGITLKAVSGYRSYATQKSIFSRNADLKGEEVANRTSARPGQSEHQTGLAMDVSSASANYELEPKFGDTKEGKWLAAHCAEYGFIIRFLNGEEDVTGYSYEPWHVRYVGKEAAKQIMKQGVTLEAYLEAAANGATKA
ncbi:D-alanyl-D-alanine carboxypeptidase family protein [Cohnella sp. GbtcB17]|uniref:M15 family metallopeptidase n=1 Tax=Cohnella sp. GbtcB17 TaxID=2824762 RepID=UPI001C311A0D|nr:M15 family metallopeptidase [Cohnella sp. GbtcB17]